MFKNLGGSPSCLHGWEKYATCIAKKKKKKPWLADFVEGGKKNNKRGERWLWKTITTKDT